jgi:glycosyltransferase involved in cell wall biosynthesis
VNVLHVLGSAERIGGAESHALSLVAAQEAAGTSVAILTPKNATLDRVRAFDPDVLHFHGSPLELELERELQSSYPTVRSLHDFAFGCASAQHYFRDGTACPRAHGRGCLAHAAVHGCAHRLDPRPFVSAYRNVGERLPLVRGAGAVVTYSDFVRASAEANGVSADRCRVIPYFVTRKDAPPALPDARDVAFVGRLSRAKGLDVLLRALALDGEAWHRLRVVGEGWHRSECEALATRLGIAGRVDWLGWLEPDGVADVLHETRVLALPSRWPEPFGIVGIEAMAHGRPVVGSRVGGIPEWLEDGETGFLVAPGEPTLLASAVSAALDDAERLGRAAWERAERFSPTAHLAALDQVYGEVA